MEYRKDETSGVLVNETPAKPIDETIPKIIHFNHSDLNKNEEKDWTPFNSLPAPPSNYIENFYKDNLSTYLKIFNKIKKETNEILNNSGNKYNKINIFKTYESKNNEILKDSENKYHTNYIIRAYES